MSRRLLSSRPRDRGRASTASSSSRTNPPVELPEYEPLSCPVDAKSRRALEELASNRQDTTKYAEQLSKCLKLLSDSVRDTNDALVERRSNLKGLRERRGAAADKDERERAAERAVARLQGEVPDLTKQSEAGVRQVIDWQVELADTRTALEETARRMEVASTLAASKQRDRREKEGREDDDDDVDDAADVAAPQKTFEDECQKLSADYASKSMYERYALNNDYINFKRMWHDALHGEDGRPVPDASRWFAEGDQDGADEDEDLIVAQEKHSVTCPLSLQVMESPYTSRTCKHTFDKEALSQYLAGQSKTCPESACSQASPLAGAPKNRMLTKKYRWSPWTISTSTRSCSVVSDVIKPARRRRMMMMMTTMTTT